MAHGGGLRLNLDGRRPLPPAAGAARLLDFSRAQRLHAELLQLLAPQPQGLGALGVVAQVAVARHLQGPDQAVHRAAAAPGVVVDAEVGEARHGQQDLLGGRAQPVVLEEQRGELGEAAERSVLHHGDLVLLQVEALQLGELGEHVVPQNLERKTCGGSAEISSVADSSLKAPM